MFQDRHDAGQALAIQLRKYADRSDTLVLALPRGGVPVGYEVAQALKAPLDVFMVRKLGVPGHEELAFGAIASGGARVLNDRVIRGLGLSQTAIDEVTAEETRELSRRERVYRDDQPLPSIRDKIVILVDDGLATGSTMRAAVKALRGLGPERIVVAVPVGAPETCSDLASEADEVVCATQPERFQAVGQWYSDFSQTTDEEVRILLGRGLAAELH